MRTCTYDILLIIAIAFMVMCQEDGLQCTGCTTIAMLSSQAAGFNYENLATRCVPVRQCLQR